MQGLGVRRPRSRRRTSRRRGGGTPPRGRASGAGCRASGRARGRPARPRASSRPSRRRSADRPRASASPRRPPPRARAPAAPRRRCRPRRTWRPARGPPFGSGKHLRGRSSLRQRPVQRVGGQLRCVPLGGRQPADRLVDLVGPDPSRLQHRRPVDHLRYSRRSRPRRPAPLGVEGDPGRSALLNARETRERSPHAAPPAAPVKAS